MTTLNLTHSLPELLEEAARISGYEWVGIIDGPGLGPIAKKDGHSYRFNPFTEFTTVSQRQALLAGLEREGWHYRFRDVLLMVISRDISSYKPLCDELERSWAAISATEIQLLQAFDAIYPDIVKAREGKA
jgi:hypothetical protein